MGYYSKNGGLIGRGNINSPTGVHDIIISQLIPFVEGLYQFSTFTFTNGTQTGAIGPSLGGLLAAYDTSTYPWLNDTEYFNVNGGIQEWTVPSNGTYRIEAQGARGGNDPNGSGGAGARIITDIDLSINDKLRILVGQNGGDRSGAGNNLTGAGGGGTFVTRYVAPLSSTQESDIIVIAGGGGGSGSGIGGGPGQISNSGQDGLSATVSGFGGINGGGGGAGQSGLSGNGTTDGGVGGSCSYGSGGGGFFSNGGRNCNGASPFVAGIAFIAGGAGGPPDTGRSGVPGGFGGGAGVGHRASGGGGYSGGGGDGNATGGGGGGSYWSGTLVSSTAGHNSGNGLVTITRL